MFRKSHPNKYYRRPDRSGKYAVTPEAMAVAAARGSEYIHKADISQAPDADTPTVAFSELPLDPRIVTNVEARGYERTTPIQDAAIRPVLEGRDVVGIANTGTGKTAAFLLPLIHRTISGVTSRTLIIVPTRELAIQVDDELKVFAAGLQISSVLCIGGVGMGPQIDALRRTPRFVICTPGRIRDLIERRHVDLSSFDAVVLDEVDRMVDAGFIRDIRHIVSLLPRTRQSLFFSATIPPDAEPIVRSFLTDPVTVSVKRKETAASIDQDMVRVAGREDKLQKLEELLKSGEMTKVLIFGRTKWGVEKLAKVLRAKGFSVDSIHGNKSQSQRIRVLENFKLNRINVLVATDIAARGLDIEGVSHVVNFDEPPTYTDYVHRIGRTGRANHVGKAITFVE